MKKNLTMLAVLLLAGFTAPLAAQAKKQAVLPRILAYVEKPSAIYKVGEKIRFKVWFVQPPRNRFLDHQLKDCKIIPGKKIDYVIKGDGGLYKKGSITSDTKEVIIETSLTRPGFVLLSLTHGKGKSAIKRNAGAGVEPEKIRSGTKMPADFEAYWKNRIKKMRARKAKITVREATEYIKPNNKNLVRIYDVTIADGELTATGILTIPRFPDKKRLPILIGFGGASWIGAGPNVIESVYRNVIYFSMNIHGIKNYVPTAKEKAQIRKQPGIGNYHFAYLDDREKFGVGKVYMRIVRCLDYLKTLPEWNGKDLIASGPSFGGCQSIIAAALDKDVTLALAGAPACCDHEGAVNNQNPGYPRLLSYYNNPKRFSAEVRAKARKNAPYFDAANMARLVKCPIVFSVGFIDTVCSPTSIYSAYNNVPGKNKSIIHGVYAAHGHSLVPGDNNAFGAGHSILYRELAAGKELLVNGAFLYQIPGSRKGEFHPYAWEVRGKDVQVKKEGKKAYLSLAKGSKVYQNVYNLRKKEGKVTIKGKFRGKGKNFFHLTGAIAPIQRIMTATSPRKWQEFSYTYKVRKGSYVYGVTFLAGKDTLLEVSDISVTLQ